MTDQRSDATTGATDVTGAAEPSAGVQARRRRRWRLASAVAVAAVVVAGAAFGAAYVVLGRNGGTQQPDRPAGIASSITNAQVNLMELSALSGGLAPGFRLTDQSGRTLSLSDLRGKVVVLEFMDPHCTDICPIVSAEFVDAYHDLGKLAPKVVFAAINVNKWYPKPSDMMAFSRAHQLLTIPDWHFFTGSLPALRRSWNDYNVTVESGGPNVDVQHSSMVYFIDQSGHERYLASPTVNHTPAGKAFLPAGAITGWGQGIAQVVRTMLH